MVCSCVFLFVLIVVRWVQFFQSLPFLENYRGSTAANMCVHFVGGGLAGITAATATYPLDLIRTRLAAQVE